VTETIEYEQFDQAAPNGRAATELDLSRLSEIPMELSVEIGRTHMTVGETLDLRIGSVVTLERLAGEAADLLVNGTAIARGEVVVIEEQYGLRITEILNGEQEQGLEEGVGVPAEDDGGEGQEPAQAAPAEAAPVQAAPAEDPAGES
jgi:flagellar motor switch protein FliN